MFKCPNLPTEEHTFVDDVFNVHTMGEVKFH